MKYIPAASDFSFSRTLEVRDHCLCLHTQRVARALARRFDTAFQPLGLTSGQFSILVALNRPESPTIGAVAALLAMDRTTLTAALKPLERAGYATSAADPKDRRARRLSLTTEGRALLTRAWPIWHETHETIQAAAPMVDFPALRSFLQALASGNVAASAAVESGTAHPALAENTADAPKLGLCRSSKVAGAAQTARTRGRRT